MTLAHALFLLHERGHVALVLHRDHLCSGAWSHTFDRCPRAPYHAHSALEVAEVESARELEEILERKAIAFGALVGAPAR
jgi:hypothetical protein